MSSSAWTRKAGERPGSNVSYAERLRQAHTRPESSNSDSSEQNAKISSHFADSDASQPSASSEASTSSRPMLRSPKASVPSTPSSLSPPRKTLSESELESTSQDNVWVLRMRRRNHRDIHAKQDADEFVSLLTMKNRKGSSSQHSPSTSSPPVHIEPDLSLEGVKDDAWLRRIHMLNGGKSAPRFVRPTSESSSSNTLSPMLSTQNTAAEASHASTMSPLAMSLPTHAPHTSGASPSPSGWARPWPHQSGPQPMYFMTPYGMLPFHAAVPTTNADGSFSPYCSSDPLQQSMRNATQMPMGYAPIIPMPEAPESSMWSRRGRSNRGRAPLRTPSQSHGAMSDAPRNSHTPAKQSEGRADEHASMGHGESEEESNRSDADSEPIGAPRATLSPNLMSGTRKPKWQPSPFGGMSSHMMPYMNQRSGLPMPFSLPIPPYIPMDPNVCPQVPVPLFPWYGYTPVSAASSDASALLQHLRTQVEFYFSDANLASDFYLRQQMDKQGFVPLDTILAFKRLRSMFQNAIPNTSRSAEPEGVPKERQRELLCAALMTSQSLEMNENCTRVRRLGHWQSFILPSETSDN